MSRNFQNKNKDLVKLQVFNSRDVWCRNSKGQYVYKKDLDIYGKVDKGTSAFITNTNMKGKNTRFIEDTTNLPKSIKNDIVKHLYSNHKTAYLVKKK